MLGKYVYQYVHSYACVCIHTIIGSTEILTAGAAEPVVNESCWGSTCVSMHTVHVCVYVHTNIECANEILVAASAEPDVNRICSGRTCVGMCTSMHA